MIANKIESFSLLEAGFLEEPLYKIDKTFIKAIQNNEIPGAVIAISRYGKIVYKRAFGMQVPQKKNPITKDSIFRINSMTQSVTNRMKLRLLLRKLVYQTIIN